MTETNSVRAADTSSVLPVVRTVKAAAETLEDLARRRELDAELNFVPANGVGYRYNQQGEIDPQGTLTLTELHTGPERPVAEPLDRHVVAAEGGSIRHQERGFIRRIARMLTPNERETARISRQPDERLYAHLQHALVKGQHAPQSLWDLKDAAHQLPDGEVKRRYLNTIANRETQRDRWLTQHRRDLLPAVVASDTLDCRLRLRAARALEGGPGRERTLGQVAGVRAALREVGRGDLAGKLGEHTIAREWLREELETRGQLRLYGDRRAVGADSSPAEWAGYLTTAVCDRLAYDPVWAATPPRARPRGQRERGERAYEGRER